MKRAIRSETDCIEKANEQLKVPEDRPLGFFTSSAEGTDIFCLLEVPDLYEINPLSESLLECTAGTQENTFDAAGRMETGNNHNGEPQTSTRKVIGISWDCLSRRRRTAKNMDRHTTISHGCRVAIMRAICYDLYGPIYKTLSEEIVPLPKSLRKSSIFNDDLPNFPIICTERFNIFFPSIISGAGGYRNDPSSDTTIHMNNDNGQEELSDNLNKSSFCGVEQSNKLFAQLYPFELKADGRFHLSKKARDVIDYLFTWCNIDKKKWFLSNKFLDSNKTNLDAENIDTDSFNPPSRKRQRICPETSYSPSSSPYSSPSSSPSCAADVAATDINSSPSSENEENETEKFTTAATADELRTLRNQSNILPLVIVPFVILYLPRLTPQQRYASVVYNIDLCRDILKLNTHLFTMHEMLIHTKVLNLCAYLINSISGQDLFRSVQIPNFKTETEMMCTSSISDNSSRADPPSFLSSPPKRDTPQSLDKIEPIRDTVEIKKAQCDYVTVQKLLERFFIEPDILSRQPMELEIQARSYNRPALVLIRTFNLFCQDHEIPFRFSLGTPTIISSYQQKPILPMPSFNGKRQRSDKCSVEKKKSFARKKARKSDLIPVIAEILERDSVEYTTFQCSALGFSDACEKLATRFNDLCFLYNLQHKISLIVTTNK